MREEVERVVQDEGWTKAAMQKMRRVDSFIREVMRRYPLDSGTLMVLSFKYRPE